MTLTKLFFLRSCQRSQILLRVTAPFYLQTLFCLCFSRKQTPSTEKNRCFENKKKLTGLPSSQSASPSMEAMVQTGDPESQGGQGASATKVLVLEHPPPASAPPASPTIRLVLQQCMSAQLMVQPAMEGALPQFVEIQRGMIIYVCFLKGATKAQVEKIAKMALTVRLSEGDNGKLVSVIDLPGDILIIPQATLGGTPKGKVMQYHKNIVKEEGQQLYTEFISIFKKTYERSEKCAAAGSIVRFGTYGNRQVFSCQTNGPYTHLIEI